MLYLALASFAFAGFVLVSGAGLVRYLVRALAREREAAQRNEMQLLDRLAHAHQQPWTLPPREPLPLIEPSPEPEEADLFAEPEQLPA